MSDLPKAIAGGLGLEPRSSDSHVHTLNPRVALPQKQDMSQQRDGETAHQRLQNVKINARQE